MVARGLRRALVASVVAGGASVAGGCSGDAEPESAEPSAGAPPTGTGGAEAPTGGRGASASGGATAKGGRPAAGTTGADSGGAATGGSSNGGAPVSVSGAGGSSGAGSSSGGSSPAAGGSPAPGGAGDDGRDPECPESLTAALLSASKGCSKPGLVCSVPVDCNTGSQALRMTCENQTWEVPQGCDEPFNFCVDATGGVGETVASADCEDRSWVIDSWLSSFGPRPCPAEPPADEMLCDAIGGTESSGDRKHCGYPCSGGEGWSVISCTGEGRDAKWLSDGACY